MSEQPEVEPHLTDDAESIRRFGRLLLAKKNVQDTADAVLAASHAWEIAREDRGWHPTEYNVACGELEDAVRAHRKALAEQEKESKS